MSIKTTKGNFKKLVREEYMRFLQEMDEAPLSAADQDQIDDVARDIAKALIQTISQHPHLPSDKVLTAVIEDAQQLVARRNS
jgi:hypothetical protein